MVSRSTSVALDECAKERTSKACAQAAKLDIIGFQTILDKLNYQSRAAAGELLVMLFNLGINIVTVESLTAGKIASTLIDIPSYGGNVYGGFVVYDTDAKREFVDVTTKSVYSQKCAKQMAEGALKNSRAMCALAVTGHAGGFDDTDPEFLGYVDMGFSYRTSENDFVTETKRVKFCDLKDIGSSCKEYKARLQALHVLLPPLSNKDKSPVPSPYKEDLTKIQELLSPRGLPFSDDLYQMRMIIRTACVAEACLFARTILSDLSNLKFFDQYKETIFTAKPRDKALKSCQEPSRIIRNFMKAGPNFDKDYTGIKWAEHFGNTGDASDSNYDPWCNQDDIPSSRPTRNNVNRNSTVPQRIPSGKRTLTRTSSQGKGKSNTTMRRSFIVNV